MRQILYEYKKIMFKPILLVLIVVFTLADIYVLINRSDDYAPFSSVPTAEKVYNDFAEKTQGNITVENIELIVEKYNEASEKISGDFSVDFDLDSTYTGYLQSDFNVFSELYEGIKRNYYYADNIEVILETAQSNAKYYKNTDNTEQYNKYTKMHKVYKDRVISGFYRTDGFEMLFDHTFSSFLMIVLLMFALSGIIVSEKECGMNALILSTKNGHRCFACYKTLACVLVSVTFVVWFSLVDLATIAFTNGLYGWSNPLYSLPTYQFSPAPWSIGCHVVFCMLFKSVGLTCLSSVIAICSLNAKGTVSAFSFSCIIIVVLIFLDDISRISSVNNIFTMMNPVSAFTIQSRILKFDCFSLKQICIENWVLNCGLVLLTAIMLSVFAAIARNNRRKLI